MGILLFRAFLVINAFNIATENPVTPNPYRFPVYSVNECPKSENEFKTAAQRRNCTRGSRYLCAPNKYISSLIEFCTDRPRSLYGKGFCVLLEGTGDLNHYSCVEKFNGSCPSEPYYDEDIFKYPACLEIDKELRCFVADNNCNKRELSTIETPLNISKMETVGNETFRRASPGLLTIVYIIAVVSAGMILIWVIFQKRRKEQGERYKNKDENKSLLKDPEPPIEQNDDVQLDQTAINVSKHNQIQTTSTEMVSETVKKDTQTPKTIQREEKRKEESGDKTATLDGKQQHNREIDDEKLRQFLSKGNISVCHVRCIIVGCGKAGKTTLLKRLQNVSLDDLMEIERTEMVDFHVNSFEVLLEEETIQSVNKEDAVPTILFSKEKLEMGLKANAEKMTEEADQPGVGKNLLVENSSQKNTENIPRDVPNNPANNNNAENEGESIPEPQDKIFVQNQLSPNTNETHVEDDKINVVKYAILKIKDDVNELLNENDLRPRITFLDFAGQSMYYAFHQIFLRPKSCSILVVDMRKSLNDEVDVQDGNEKECSQFASWRYRDYYKFWLKSIDSFSDTESPVIIVGTHADKLSKEECRKFRESLLKFFDNLSHSNLRRHINADRMYTIGFPDSGSELEDLKDIKKCIAYIVKCPRHSKENIRPVWALFEHILNRLKETEKVISQKTLSDYCDQLSAQEFRLDQSEISKMLVFFHKVGVLLYFDQDGLKEKIILDIQWLLDAFKCIIEYPVRPEENDIKRMHFCRTGELDNAELDRIWHIQGKDFLKHKTTIIAYMQQLGLLMPLKELHSIDSTVYYFPSMNSKRFDKTGENNSKSSIICFKFDDEMQIPINVFHGIVLKCSKLNNWSILTEGAKNNICLYQNAVCFSFQKHVVVLCNCNFEIRVQVWASPKIYDGRLLKKIKQSVEDIIHDDNLSYKIGYKCRKDVLNVEEDVSFISESIFPVSNYLCEICDVDKKHVVDNDICWDFEVIDENQGTDQISMEGLEKELRKLFAGGTSDDYVKCAAKKLSDLTGTDVADVFQKLAYGVDILSKLTGCSTVPVLSFTLSLSALSSMFKNIGSNLKSADAPVEEDSIFVALERYGDSELKAEAAGLVDLLFIKNAYFGEINDQAHESLVNKLEDKFPTNDIVKFMGKLKAKTHELLTTSDPHSARQASVYINLYFRLANLRTLVLWQMFCIKERRNYDQQSTRGVLAMINEGQKSDMEVFRYVTDTSFQKAVFHTIFHPTENENFMNFICIHRIRIPSLAHDKKFCRRKHFIRSSKLPDYRFEMMSPKTDFIGGSQNSSFACKFYLEPVRNRKLDGVFYMRSVKWSDSYVSMDKDGKCVSVSDKPGSEGQWKVVRLDNEGLLPQFLFSTLKWPCKFLFLKSCWRTFSIEGTENLKASKESCLWEILDV